MLNLKLVLMMMSKFMTGMILMVNTLKILMLKMLIKMNQILFLARTPDYRSSYREPWRRRPRLPGRPGPR